MKIQFLGTGGFHPTERRHTAGVLLPEIGVAFDAGTSAFRLAPRLKSPNLFLFLSHAHLDHICGLTYLLVPLIQKSIQTCVIHTTAEVIAASEEHMLKPPIFPIRPRLDFVEIPEKVEIPAGVVRWHPLHHPGGAIGFRLDLHNGKSIAYMSDTNANDDSIEFLRGVQVLIHECTYPDSQKQWCDITGHSHTTQVAKLARAANVGRLILTHIDPYVEGDDPVVLPDATAIFPNTALAEDLSEFEF
ncbi:MAG: MBL fold metallo-hydrolase [Planctomycetaceae bacterium]|nr:MBL fold metallo-hydrolase [Planctomycetaceae bacterium]